MKSIRVLITTYQSAFLRPGGGEAELKNLVKILYHLGVDADIYGSTSKSIDAYDVVLHFSVHGESFEFIKSIQAMGKKIILWPNLWMKDKIADADSSFIKSFLDMADVVIFKSQAELQNVSEYILLEKIVHEIVPWHIDSKYNERISSTAFRELYNIDSYILWVGVIESDKNQLAAIKALYNYDLPLVFIGGHRDKEYFDQCRKNASSKTLFLPFMEQGSDMLRSAYSGCSAYMELSNDPAGLSSLEAALYEKPMILSKNEWSIEEFGGQIALIDEGSSDEIIQAIDGAMHGKYKYAGKQKIIKRHLMPESLASLVNLINDLGSKDAS